MKGAGVSNANNAQTMQQQRKTMSQMGWDESNETVVCQTFNLIWASL